MAVNNEINKKVIELYNRLYMEGKFHSQKEFCKMIDYEEPSFSHVLNGRRTFPKNKLPVLITLFGLDRDYFTTNTYTGKQDVCDKITHIRKLKELTQREFAQKLNVTQSAISAIENKTNRQPGYDILWGLINRMKVNPYFIFSDDHIVFDSSKKFSNRAKLDLAISNIKDAINNLNSIKL